MLHPLLIIFTCLTLSLAEFANSQGCLAHQFCVPANECPPTQTGSILFSCQNGKGICCGKPDTAVRHPKLLTNNQSDTTSQDLKRHKNYFLLPKDCGRADLFVYIDNKMEDGDPTDHGEFPWMAYILVIQQRKVLGHCSGTIIHQRHILTAGHCTVGFKEKRVTVFVGLESLTCANNNSCPTSVQKMVVEKMIRHENYKRTDAGSFVNDIALIRLRDSLTFTAFIMPACLPFEESLRGRMSRRRLTLLGWGPDATNNKSRVLQKLNAKFVDSEMCSQLWNIPLLLIQKSQMCIIGDGGSKPTQGDSGGPLLIQNSKGTTFVAAITSVGSKTRRDLPAILTRVGKYNEWILDNL